MNSFVLLVATLAFALAGATPIHVSSSVSFGTFNPGPLVTINGQPATPAQIQQLSAIFPFLQNLLQLAPTGRQLFPSIPNVPQSPLDLSMFWNFFNLIMQGQNPLAPVAVPAGRQLLPFPSFPTPTVPTVPQSPLDLSMFWNFFNLLMQGQNPLAPVAVPAGRQLLPFPSFPTPTVFPTAPNLPQIPLDMNMLMNFFSLLMQGQNPLAPVSAPTASPPLHH